ncbi:MAG: flavin reductase family protein [Bacteroidetes bacterium]|nr:flavin reductase family protein [Bacteroidota bacterium]
MKSFNPNDHPVPFVHRLLLSGVAPRPIALVGTQDREGRVNLSPFSFFNAFGANPPVIVVSPAYRGKDGTTKHSFENIRDTGEFTVSAVSHSMVEQISLASSDYEQGEDEFLKAGFGKLTSDIVAPPGVAEAPFVMECRLLHHFDTGAKPGSGNLMIAEVVMFHVRESAFEGDRIDPRRLDLVARMGYNWYCRANGDALFELPKPAHNGIGIDALPQHLRESDILTGNNLARLASVVEIPDGEEILLRWKEDLQGIDPAQTPADMFDVELRLGEAHRAVLSVFAAWKRQELRANECSRRLQHCTRLALDQNQMSLAWECALMSDPEAVAALSVTR